MNAIRSPRRLLLAGLILAIAAAFADPVATAFATRLPDARRHAKLLKSSPAAKETVRATPTAIRLWFSEPVTLGLSRITLAGAGGAIATGKATHLPGGDAASLTASVRAPMPAGTYTVRWIVASDDGHPMRGSFSFTVVPGH